MVDFPGSCRRRLFRTRDCIFFGALPSTLGLKPHRCSVDSLLTYTLLLVGSPLGFVSEHKAPHPLPGSLTGCAINWSISQPFPLPRAERQLSPRTGRSTSRKRGCIVPIGRIRHRISWVSKEATLRLARRNPGLGDLHSSSRCDVYQQVATIGGTRLSLE